MEISSTKGLDYLKKRRKTLPSSYYSSDGDYLRGYPSQMYSRRADALTLRKTRNAAKCASEKTICISACGVKDEWDDNLYGFTRVVVHGTDSLCVVARTEDVERVMCQAKEAYPYMCTLILKNALIYEAEDLAFPLGEHNKMTCRSFEKPFVAASVMPGPNSGHEASGDEYDVNSATGFLEQEMKSLNSCSTFTFDQSVKTAIFTLEYLFGRRFKANEIKVFYVKNHTGRVVGGRGSSEVANEFPVRGEPCVKDHLAVIKKLPHIGGSSISDGSNGYDY